MGKKRKEKREKEAAEKLKQAAEDLKEEEGETTACEKEEVVEIVVDRVSDEGKEDDEVKADDGKEEEVKEQEPAKPKVDASELFSSLEESQPSKTLDHVTKARPRGPPRNNKRTRRGRGKTNETTPQVSDFFNEDVSTKDFSNALTIEELQAEAKKEKAEAKKDKEEEKKQPKRIGGMGMGGGMGMMVTPDMLKKKKSPMKTPVDPPEEKEEPAVEEDTAEVVEDKQASSPPPTRRP